MAVCAILITLPGCSCTPPPGRRSFMPQFKLLATRLILIVILSLPHWNSGPQPAGAGESPAAGSEAGVRPLMKDSDHDDRRPGRDSASES